MGGWLTVAGRARSRGLLTLLMLLLALSSAPVGMAGNLAGISSSILPTLQDFQLVADEEGWVLVDQHLYWTVDGGQAWEDITPPGLHRTTIRAVAFLDTQRGWLVATRMEDSGLVTYVLAQTVDGGSTWQMRPLSLFGPGDSEPLAVAVYLHLLDPQTGWLVVKHATGANFSLGSLFQTTDGGDTWTQLTIPIGEPVTFVTSEHGWTAGGAAGDELYHTEDGGQTWQTRAIGIPAEQTTAGQLLYELPTFDTPQEGVLPLVNMGIGETYVEFYITSDGGQSWKQAARVPLAQEIVPGTPLPVSVVDAGHWVMSAPGSQQLLHISDYGKVVTVVGLGPPVEGFSELDMVTVEAGWAKVMFGGCDGSPQPENAVMLSTTSTARCWLDIELVQTQDGGKTWTVLTLPEMGEQAAAANQSIPFTEPDLPSTDGHGIEGSGSRTAAFVGQGFDKCEIPTLGQLQAWITGSPYGAVNLYIGGSCRGCPNTGLTADFVAQASQQGWKFIPTWVGPQSSCWGGGCSSRISNNPTTAYNQGVTEADAALAVAIDLGLAEADGSGTIIYSDLEGYGGADPTCRSAAKSFIDGWTARLHQRGSAAGVYTSSCGGALSDFASLDHVPDAVWPAHWIYSHYSIDASVWGVACLSDGWWASHQRIRQYTGGHTESWGGVALNIDCDVIDGIVANINGTCCDCLPASCCSGAMAQADGSFSEFRWSESSLPNTATPGLCAASGTCDAADIFEVASPSDEEESDTAEEPSSWDHELRITTTVSTTEPTGFPPDGVDPVDSPAMVGVPVQRGPVESEHTPPTSASYRIPRSVFGSGGGAKSSAHYVLNTTQGQSTDLSRRTSASYVLVPGYWSRWSPFVPEHRVYLPLVVRNH